MKGSKVTAIAYGDNMEPTGETFPATITGSLGAFLIDVKDANAAYYELKAEGCYFDEITGNITDLPICLEAFVSSYESKANLNIFTTITKGRIMKLVLKGMNYEEAKNQAQVEFLKTVNLAGADIDFTRLDITGGSDADAMLLMTTCTIQNQRNAGELTVILQNAASEFKENGSFSENTAKGLFQLGRGLDFEIVFDNLKKYYDENGLSKDDLPSYWKYFYLGTDETMRIISIKGFPGTNLSTESSEACSGTIKLVSIEPFTVTSDVDWITFETSEVEKEVFEIKVYIAENKSYERREGKIIITGQKSNVKRMRRFSQGQAFPDVDPKKSLKGMGTPYNVYLIENLDDLLYMRDVYNSTGDRFILSRTDSLSRPAHDAFFSLVADIDLSPVCGPDKGDWTPIGVVQDGLDYVEIRGFDGTLNCWKSDSDGICLNNQPGYKISGLYINNGKDFQGLFGAIKGGYVRGLVVEGNVSGGHRVGLLAGDGINTTNDKFWCIGGVKDIETRGIVSGIHDVGGILGSHTSGFMIENCVSNAEVTQSHD